MAASEIDRDTFPRKGKRRLVLSMLKNCDACTGTADLKRDIEISETETRTVLLCRMCDHYSPAMLLLLLEAEAAK
ncbi:MAG: hypothetical protein KAI41_06165 [Hyphomicrobiaceae bacterium]|nr:hypothetical protein [Hyphomicrobiaceae bacterium]